MSTDRQRWALAAALAAGLVAASLPASARQAGPPAGDPRAAQVVMLSERTAEETNADVFQAVIGQLSDLPVELRVDWLDDLPQTLEAQIAAADAIARQAPTLAVFWVVTESEERILLHIADSQRRRILVRRLDRSAAGAQYEELALIVRASIDALLKGGAIGVAPPPAPEQPAAESPPAPPPPSAKPPAPSHKPPAPAPWLALEAGYDLVIHSEQHPVIHGMHLTLSANPVGGLTVRLGYVVQTPVVVEDRLVTISVQHHPVLAAAGYVWRLGRIWLGGSVTLVADYAVQETGRLASTTADRHENSDLLIAVTPALDLGLELNDRVALRLSAGPEIITNNIRYIYMTNTGRKVILEPWTVETRIFAGVAVWMF